MLLLIRHFRAAGQCRLLPCHHVPYHPLVSYSSPSPTKILDTKFYTVPIPSLPQYDYTPSIPTAALKNLIRTAYYGVGVTTLSNFLHGTNAPPKDPPSRRRVLTRQRTKSFRTSPVKRRKSEKGVKSSFNNTGFGVVRFMSANLGFLKKQSRERVY
ncbi:hypothetical protein CDAR_50801 [Caerostris darwini]|uniref:Uncharacterized protein n=1 Tax=Caerostris darwini TaxID=1538125 RepID=A0AAV4U667_9ARAC|nr:hypothetical protein CDAR_50801 [Caerostris darwini]